MKKRQWLMLSIDRCKAAQPSNQWTKPVKAIMKVQPSSTLMMFTPHFETSCGQTLASPLVSLPILLLSKPSWAQTTSSLKNPTKTTTTTMESAICTILTTTTTVFTTLSNVSTDAMVLTPSTTTTMVSSISMIGTTTTTVSSKDQSTTQLSKHKDLIQETYPLIDSSLKQLSTHGLQHLLL